MPGNLPRKKKPEDSIDQRGSSVASPTKSGAATMLKRRSSSGPIKGRVTNDSGQKHNYHNDYRDDDESDSDDNSFDNDSGSSLNSFLVDDEQVMLEEAEAKQKLKEKRLRQKKRGPVVEDSDDEPLLKKKKKNVRRHVESDEDDMDSGDNEVIQASKGLPANLRKKSGRLVKMSTQEAQKTKSDKQIEQEAKDAKKIENYKKIFEDGGDKEEEKNEEKVEHQHDDEEMEIDDPFVTPFDKLVVKTDIPERIQLKMVDRVTNVTQEDLKEEAKWILHKLALTFHHYSYSPEAEDKVFQVLSMLRVEHHDVPFIVHFKKEFYQDELDEEAVWLIFNYDRQFAQFQMQKKKIQALLEKIRQIEPKIKIHLDELATAMTMSELNNFSYLMRFLQSFYAEELAAVAGQDGQNTDNKKKMPTQRDEIKIAKKHKLHEFNEQCFLPWDKFLQNLFHYKEMKNKFQSVEEFHANVFNNIHKPPDPVIEPAMTAQIYERLEDTPFDKTLKVFNGTCNLAATELAAQPYLRKMIKDDLRQNGYLWTYPTAQGKKTLDVFHSSYRVKQIQQRKLSDLKGDPIYLDIAQNEADGLITVRIQGNPEEEENQKRNLRSLYSVQVVNKENWNILRTEVMKSLFGRFYRTADQKDGEPGKQDKGPTDLELEIRQELKDEAEQVVLRQAQEKYYEMLMKGPLTTPSIPKELEPVMSRKKSQAIVQDDIIPDRERLNVLGAIMQRVDVNQFVITVAVVDKWGELVAHRDFTHLYRTRKKSSPESQQPAVPENKNTVKDARQKQIEEEEKMHKRDKQRFQDLLITKEVDLIVVAATSLDSRNLHSFFKDKEHFEMRGKGDSVIYGSPEVPKLFSMSHNSLLMHKDLPSVLRQAISLCRFEQDPMSEILNLWSHVTPENQALGLQLHSLQKLCNQTKLASALEETSVKVVNKVGVDLNLIVDHEHMHSQLQFISGLGPRKAKHLIERIRQQESFIHTRKCLYGQRFLARTVFITSNAFLKIKIPHEKLDDNQEVVILDQTRIPIQNYKVTYLIAESACVAQPNFENTNPDQRYVQDVIAKPEKLSKFSVNEFCEKTGDASSKFMSPLILDELRYPFHDPREMRLLGNQAHDLSLTDKKKLLYMMIDENEQSFREGMIVTATVQRVFPTNEQSEKSTGTEKAICRLDNGLQASISAKDILVNIGEKLKDKLPLGNSVTGRIKDIRTQEVHQFEVTLECKHSSLQDHDNYIEKLTGLTKDQVPEDDRKNANFQHSNKPKQRMLQSRRIAFDKFKNINSRKAVQDLTESEVGDFIFRPSTRSDNNITLTWKFWKKNIVHIDIQEEEKPPGATIGAKLKIGEEDFGNLREIVERYIIPCNRLLRECVKHPKFFDSEDYECLAQSVKEEKEEDMSKIPYRFGVIHDYPQHIVLVYVPKNNVVKEFIRVNPKGFRFHGDIHSPFQGLINWFKDNWRSREYQSYYRRQRSPRLTARVLQPPVAPEGEQKFSKVEQWGSSVHPDAMAQAPQQQQQQQQQRIQRPDYGSAMKSPYAQRSTRMDDGMKSPHQWQQNAGAAWAGNHNPEEKHGQFDFNQSAIRQPPQPSFPERRDAPPRSMSGGQKCYNCGQEGHFSRSCPDRDQRSYERDAYKRQRTNEGGSYQRDG